MISDDMIKKIDLQISRKIQKSSSMSILKAKLSLKADQVNKMNKPFDKSLIKERLPNLIRKLNQPQFTVNQSIRKSPSPFSKSKLKNLLQSKKDECIMNVVKKSSVNGDQVSSLLQRTQLKVRKCESRQIYSNNSSHSNFKGKENNNMQLKLNKTNLQSKRQIIMKDQEVSKRYKKNSLYLQTKTPSSFFMCFQR